MSLAVFLTALGGVVIGLLAVVHQTIRMRAVRNAEVRADVIPEDFAADSVVAEMDVATADIAELDDKLRALTQAAVRQTRLRMAELGIEAHHGPIKKFSPKGGAHLVKIRDDLYQWRYRKASGATDPVIEEYTTREAAIKAIVEGKTVKLPVSLIAEGLVFEHPPSIPPRRNPATPAQATDRPSPSKVR
ncbi:hypothetical protein [Rhizobium phaseoli]|uniref:hypothetical protein n=1 Tax=Rhizobium phaseoli TaxID=396 RepID=UPI0007EA2B5D|nr:hypothetical protein [Rhizobium phaseoli]ANL35318.1 hypothetical protein AMC89_CH03290 [Rhizobium phaseoli]ANL99041.1 hypothetical protein AMC79_CH03279 [Rhizobium phaseoli]